MIDFAKVSRSSSSKAGKIAKENVEQLDMKLLSGNRADWAGEILMARPEKINFRALSGNRGAWPAEIAWQNVDKLDFTRLSRNPAEWAGEIAYRKLNDVDYVALSGNQGEWALDVAMAEIVRAERMAREIRGSTMSKEMMEEHLEETADCLDWFRLSSNPANWAGKIIKREIARVEKEKRAILERDLPNEEERALLDAIKSKVNWEGMSQNHGSWPGSLEIDVNRLNWLELLNNPANWAKRALDTID